MALPGKSLPCRPAGDNPAVGAASPRIPGGCYLRKQVARTPALGVRGSSLGIAADLADGGLRYGCLLEPFRHTLADLFLTDQFTAVRLVKTSLDFVKQVKPIQGLFDAGVVGKLLNGLQYLLLRPHGNSPISLCILPLTARESEVTGRSARCTCPERRDAAAT